MIVGRTHLTQMTVNIAKQNFSNYRLLRFTLNNFKDHLNLFVDLSSDDDFVHPRSLSVVNYLLLNKRQSHRKYLKMKVFIRNKWMHRFNCAFKLKRNVFVALINRKWNSSQELDDDCENIGKQKIECYSMSHRVIDTQSKMTELHWEISRKFWHGNNIF